MNTTKVIRSKTLDPSNWVADLKPGRVTNSDEIPSPEVDFVDAQMLDKVANSFAAQFDEIVRKHAKIGGIYLLPRSFYRKIEKLTIEKQNETTT